VSFRVTIDPFDVKPIVAIVLKGYPRLSETFIAQEILSLQQMGLDYRLVSLRHPTDKAPHPIHRDITSPVTYLPEYLYQEPVRVLKAWRAVRKKPGYRQAYKNWIKDLKRDLTANRVRRFGQAMVLAHELGPEINWIYAHFLHTPASVARYAANILDIPWSCSAHAKDIWTSPDWEKAEKLNDMKWLVTCTKSNQDHLQGLIDDRTGKVGLLYHGLDFTRFDTDERASSKLNGESHSSPVTLVSVGRAVEKKGYDVLLKALARLPADLEWQMVHVGGGELLQTLKDQAISLGLDHRIKWLGPRPQEEVLALYRQADLFVLASRIAADGDRDGLPNVLMEAQSQGVTCLSTKVSAVPELIIDGETGLLVEPDDAEELAAALERLICDPHLREKLGEAGKNRVLSAFSHHATIGELARKFGLGEAEAAK
jgi:glycosyltransferase involved in cell wall biosynthesis